MSESILPVEVLIAVMPRLRARASTDLERLLSYVRGALVEFDIATPPRIAAHLAHVAHETGELRWMTELWGPTSEQVRYSPPGQKAHELGNTVASDGYDYRGRGSLHITGKANYNEFGRLLGIDLVAEPFRAANENVAFRVGALFWSRRHLNTLADEQTRDAFKSITRRITGWYNGLPEREKYHDRARAAFGLTKVA